MQLAVRATTLDLQLQRSVDAKVHLFKLEICFCGCTRTRYRAKFFLVFPILALTNNDMKAAKS